MDSNACDAQEYPRDRFCDVDGRVLEIREYQPKDLLFLAELFWQFCHDVNQEDVSNLKTFEIDGQNIEVTEAEARIFAYLERGCSIKVAYLGDVLVGFLIYQKIFDTLYSIRCLYSEPFAQGLKLGKRLVSSLRQTPFKILFQSRKARSPMRMLQITESHRTKVDECEHFETWIMNWEVSNG